MQNTFYAKLWCMLICSLRSRHIKGWEWGRRKRIWAKNQQWSPKSLSPPPPLFTQASLSAEFQKGHYTCICNKHLIELVCSVLMHLSMLSLRGGGGGVGQAYVGHLTFQKNFWSK